MATKDTIADSQQDFDRLLSKLQTLSKVAWDGDCDEPIVNQWLEQFNGSSGVAEEDERRNMLFLLTNFLYFGTEEIRELLRSLYRDIFKYRIVARLRELNEDTTDVRLIGRHFSCELASTRFLPIGNPSESSSHLLYYFRQENRLPRNNFINPHQVFTSPEQLRLRDPSIHRYVFIDDFAGSGEQAIQYGNEVAARIREISPDADTLYYVMLSTSCALKRIRDARIFVDVDCVFELGRDFRAFSENSLCFVDAPRTVSKTIAERVAKYYGSKLVASDPLGYDDGELLIGFSHNVPDNTLPIFWFHDDSGSFWTAPFPRHPKFEMPSSNERPETGHGGRVP